MRKLNIFIIWGNFPPVIGGGSSRGYRVFKELANRGHKINVFVGKIPGTPSHERLSKNLELYRVPPSFHYPLRKGVYVRILNHFVILIRYLALFPLLVYLHLREPANLMIVEATNWEFSPKIMKFLKINTLMISPWVMFKKIFRLSVFVYFTNMWYANEIQIKGEVDYAERILIVDSWMEKRLVELGVKKEIFYVPVCIDSNKNRITPDNNIVLYVGRLSKERGCDVLIKSIPYIKEKIKDVEVVLVGGGAERENLMKLAEDLDVTENLKFVREVDSRKIDSVYASVKPKVLVNPLRLPGIGNTTIEALAYGIPVIKSKIPGYDEPVIEEGKNGYLFKLDDPENLAEKIIATLRNTGNWRALSDNALKTSKEFELERIVDRLEQILLRDFNSP
ncbi:MAG: glycosyltransferase family 4 protein [Candidatus Altiarchaeota archaeon]